MKNGRIHLEYWDNVTHGMRHVEIQEITDIFLQRIKITSTEFPGVTEVFSCKGQRLIKLWVKEEGRERLLWLNQEPTQAFARILSLFKRTKGEALVNTHARKSPYIIEKPVEPLHPIISRINKEHWVGKHAFLVFSGDEIDIGLKEAYLSKRSVKSPGLKEVNDEPIKS